MSRAVLRFMPGERSPLSPAAPIRHAIRPVCAPQGPEKQKNASRTACAFLRFHPGFLRHLSPFVSGISISSTTMPMTPTTIPSAIFPKSMLRHMPTPSIRAPTTPTRMAPSVLPLT